MVRKPPRAIAVIATLDTKSAEARFVAERIRALGYQTVVLDTGILGSDEPASPLADITADEVAGAAGEDRRWLAERRSEPGIRARAVAAMAEGSAELLRRLCGEGRLAGVIALGGAQGTEIASYAMRALPLGTPKLMVSTVACGRTPFGMFTGTRDLTIMHSVADIQGLNSLTRRILANAAGAVVGMARAESLESAGEAPRVGITIYGNTTPAGILLAKLLGDAGYEVVAFHPNGTGGVAMEELASEGWLDAILDLTTHELVDELFDGLHAGDGKRLTLAAEAGVPRLVVPGCVDFMVFAGRDAVPAAYRGQPTIAHNPHLILVRTDSHQLREIAREMSSRLNRSTGPTAVAVPAGGWSFYNRRGLAFADPQSDHVFVDELRAGLRPDIPVHIIDSHINDPEFAEAVLELFLALDVSSPPDALAETGLARHVG